MTKPLLAKRKKKKIGSKPGDKIALINARLLDPAVRPG